MLTVCQLPLYLFHTQRKIHKSYKAGDIAAAKYISVHTVNTHRKSIYFSAHQHQVLNRLFAIKNFAGLIVQVNDIK